MRRLLAMVVLLWPMFALESQPVMTPRANVAAYDGDEGIDRLAYRESPYYLELSGSWKQQHTDSSVIYRRQLDVDKVWKEYLVFLNVRCGRACRVYVNDKEVGYEDDSRLWHEFSLDKYLKYGKPNTLTIEAMLHPQGALLEDSTLTVGLNGEPYLLFKTDPCISDMAVLTDYEAGNGTLGIDVQVYNSRRKGRYYVEVEVWDPKGQQLDRMGRWVIFDKKSDVEWCVALECRAAYAVYCRGALAERENGGRRDGGHSVWLPTCRGKGWYASTQRQAYYS